jgi:hypothetical protein
MGRKLLRGAVLICLFVLVMAVLSDDIGTIVTLVIGDSMDWHTKWLARLHGVNCGRVKVRGSPTAATSCALKANADGKPFRVAYNIMGFDAFVAGGVVRTPDGELYGLSFDSDPSGGGGVSLLGQRVDISPCPKPIHLWVNPKGRINCFQQQLTRPHDIMSPNFEPY